MQTDCGRYSITFNGEIYNHLDIRRQLESENGAPDWRGHSDTETLLYAVRHWGIESAVRRLVGMFAFAIWDAKEQSLSLCRDRFGEKPLFYGWIGSDLVFASELKAFVKHPEWQATIDRRALTAFMRYSYVPAPFTIWQGIRKLNPGTFVVLDSDARRGHWPEPKPYWSMRDEVIAGQRERFTNSNTAIDRLENLLSASIARQSLSDVPLGAFLSGGIDSSTVVALMQKQSAGPVRTFSIGFSEASFNEAEHARRIARHLQTAHTELIVTPSDARAVIPKLADIYDEPFADSSQIPTHLVSSLARTAVTVSLSGDGGDELFGGYNRHVWGDRLHSKLQNIPAPMRRLIGRVLRLVAPEPANSIGEIAGRILPDRFRILRAGDQMLKIGRIVESQSLDEMYRRLSSIEDSPVATVIDGEEPRSWFNSQMESISSDLDNLDRMTLSDALSYLSDDILQKVDRAAMAVGLETRVPFLDKDVVEFSCRVPSSMKVREDGGKWILRQVLYRHVPRHLVERPKTGFGIPLDDWLRGPLKLWAADLLSSDRLVRQGLFNEPQISAKWRDHQLGQNHGSWLWNVLMAQAWVDRWSQSSTAPA